MNSDKLNHECQLNIGEHNIKDKVTRAVQSIKRKENVTINRNILKNISQNVVIPEYFHLSYGDNSGGIHTATPPSVLLVLYENGLSKYLLRKLFAKVEIPQRFKD